MTEEQREEMAALRSGRTVDEVRKGREYGKKGPQQRVEWGEEYGPGDRPEEAPSDRRPYETPDSAKGREVWGDQKVRRGLLESMIAPDKLDDYIKGSQGGDVQDAMNSGRPSASEDARQMSRNYKGDRRYFGEGGGNLILDDTSGTGTVTDLGKAEIGKDKADASRSSAAAEATRAAGPKANTAEMRAAERQFNEASDRVKQAQDELRATRLRTQTKSGALDPKTIAEESKDWKAEQAQLIKEAEARLAQYTKEKNEALERMNSVAAGNGPEAKRPTVRDAAGPPASALQEGKRTKFANGQVWTLRGGKPVRIQ